MMTKLCTRCGIEKDTTDFYRHQDRRPRKTRRDGPIGFTAWCKRCYCEKTAEWQRQFKTPAMEKRWADAVKVKQLRIKDAVFGAYGGYKCACCGEADRAFLSIDHIDNDGAKWRTETFGARNVAGRRTYHWLFKHGFPAGFQVLCMNCNFGKRMNGGICPHQEKRNDYPHEGVGSSEPKRTASVDSIH